MEKIYQVFTPVINRPEVFELLFSRDVFNNIMQDFSLALFVSKSLNFQNNFSISKHSNRTAATESLVGDIMCGPLNVRSYPRYPCYSCAAQWTSATLWSISHERFPALPAGRDARLWKKGRMLRKTINESSPSASNIYYGHRKILWQGQ